MRYLPLLVFVFILCSCRKYKREHSSLQFTAIDHTTSQPIEGVHVRINRAYKGLLNLIPNKTGSLGPYPVCVGEFYTDASGNGHADFKFDRGNRYFTEISALHYSYNPDAVLFPELEIGGNNITCELFQNHRVKVYLHSANPANKKISVYVTADESYSLAYYTGQADTVYCCEFQQFRHLKNVLRWGVDSMGAKKEFSVSANFNGFDTTSFHISY